MLSAVLLSVVGFYRYLECYYAECCFAECRGARHFLTILMFASKIKRNPNVSVIEWGLS
jgi:hypothetical protein